MKITERDKVLLVLLGVILIVALAVVLPGVGVMSCREELSTLETDSTELQSDLDAKLAQLNEMGVTQYPENAIRAADALEEKIYELKVEAAHLAGNIMGYAKPFAVDEDWVDGLEYRYGVKSDDGEKLIDYDPIENVKSSGSQEMLVFEQDDVVYSLPTHDRTIEGFSIGSAECTYMTEIATEEAGFKNVGAFLLYLHNIASKGSMLITDARLGGEKLVSFTLLMPDASSGIAVYGQEVLEEQARRAAEEAGEEIE